MGQAIMPDIDIYYINSVKSTWAYSLLPVLWGEQKALSEDRARQPTQERKSFLGAGRPFPPPWAAGPVLTIWILLFAQVKHPHGGSGRRKGNSSSNVWLNTIVEARTPGPWNCWTWKLALGTRRAIKHSERLDPCHTVGRNGAFVGG